MMANAEAFDTNFTQDMLLTYRYFTTAEDLLDMLAERYRHGEPNTNAEVKRVIQIRVVNILRKWITTYYADFEENLAIRDRLNKFVSANASEATSGAMLRSLPELLTKKVNSNRDNGGSSPLPQSITWRRGILEIHPNELAEQLTLIELDRFKKVSPLALTCQQWSRAKENPLVRPLRALIDHFNDISMWLASEILLTPNVRQRAEVIKTLLHMIRQLLNLRNYSTLLQVVAALNLTCVTRLKRTWELVPKALLSALKEANSLMGVDKGFAKYRRRISEEQPPLIPYLGLCLNDLVLIEEGNNTFAGEGLVNFVKMSKIAQVIRDIQWYQTSAYEAIKRNEPMQTWILYGTPRMSDSQLYDRSYIYEPRMGDSRTSLEGIALMVPGDDVPSEESASRRRSLGGTLRRKMADRTGIRSRASMIDTESKVRKMRG
jgi:son of sevenless